MTPQRQRLVLVALMWAGALLSVAALVAARREADRLPPVPRAPGAPPVDAVAAEGAPPPRPAVPAPPAAPPSVYRLDARHTGRSPHRGPDAGQLLWSVELGARVTAQPVADRSGTLYVGAHDGGFHAIRDGRALWRQDLGGPVWSTAAVDDAGVIYVGSDAGALHAFGSGGGLRWRLQLEGDVDTGVLLGPGGDLYVAAGRWVHRVTRTGELVWRYAADAKIFATPAALGDGTLVVGSQDDHVHALTPEGERRWVYRTEGDVDASPSIGDDGTIYVGSDDRRVYALSPEGQLRWSAHVEGMVRAPLGLTLDGAVLAGVFGPRPRLIALDAATGRERWTFSLAVADTTEIGVASGPLVDAQGNVYFGAHDDYLYALTPRGELRWAEAVAGDVDSSPVLMADGTLVVGSDDGRLYAFGRR
ncbi:MAG: PQQ-binding-like beta-propeller repeat protein [Myxococcota bacterium]